MQGSEKKIISDIKQINVGNNLDIILKKGKFSAIVDEINE